ncbi:MAG TPA: sigma-70 family RNA polymerase sigma factor [Candidatus Angelobacter sp.]|nr:sigma-70 family RNA polymerase sigma factor [Candidatus Angelobacter sp.]
MSDLAQTLSWIQDETQLVTELQSGSDTAFDWVVTYYHASVYNVIYGILADRSDAADVTQEVFLKAFRGIHGFRRGSSLKTWLYRIAVRESLNHRRWWHRHCHNEVSLDIPADENHAATEIEDLEGTPFDQLAARETQIAVRAALAELSEAYRGAVILRDLEGLSYEEVAEVLEISVATVKTRILRGRRALKKLLEPLLHAPYKDSYAAARQMSSERHVPSAHASQSTAGESQPLVSYAMALGRGQGSGPGGCQ